LAGELLREAEKLVAAKIHPMTIISGSILFFSTMAQLLLSRKCCYVVILMNFLLATSAIHSLNTRQYIQ